MIPTSKIDAAIARLNDTQKDWLCGVTRRGTIHQCWPELVDLKIIRAGGGYTTFGKLVRNRLLDELPLIDRIKSVIDWCEKGHTSKPSAYDAIRKLLTPTLADRVEAASGMDLYDMRNEIVAALRSNRL